MAKVLQSFKPAAPAAPVKDERTPQIAWEAAKDGHWVNMRVPVRMTPEGEPLGKNTSTGNGVNIGSGTFTGLKSEHGVDVAGTCTIYCPYPKEDKVSTVAVKAEPKTMSELAAEAVLLRAAKAEERRLKREAALAAAKATPTA